MSAEHNSSAANRSTVYRIGNASSCRDTPRGNLVFVFFFFFVKTGIKHCTAPLVACWISSGGEIAVASLYGEKREGEAVC